MRLYKQRLILQEVVIKPGENPALEIIQKAIDKKNLRNQQIQNYEVEAYTKGIIRTTEDISASSNSIGVGLGGSDTTELIISGILENHSKGYFKQPDSLQRNYSCTKTKRKFSSNNKHLTGED